MELAAQGASQQQAGDRVGSYPQTAAMVQQLTKALSP